MFITNWRMVLRRAWNVRLMLLAGVLSGIEAVLPVLDGFFLIPPGLFAVLSGLAAGGAFVARLVAQKDMHDGT